MQTEIAKTFTKDLLTNRLSALDGVEFSLINDLNVNNHNLTNFNNFEDIDDIVGGDADVQTASVLGNLNVMGPASFDSTLEGTTLSASSDVTVSGETTVKSTLEVQGDLIVQGNLVTLRPSILEIDDNKVVLNNNYSDSYGGLAVERFQPSSADSLVGDVINDTPFETATAMDGGSNYIILNPPEMRTSGFYDDWYISLVANEGANQVRKISSYLGNAQAYVETPWSTEPTGNTVYELFPGEFVGMFWDSDADSWVFGQSTTITNAQVIQKKTLKVPNITIKGNITTNNGTAAPIPVGTTVAFAGSTVPDGWLECDGSNYSQSSYPMLFDSIGTTYGMTGGAGTFDVPNLQNRIPTGMDSTDPNFNALGKTKPSDNTTITLASSQISSHTHTVQSAQSGSLTHSHVTSTGTTHGTDGSVDTNTNTTSSLINGTPQSHGHPFTPNTGGALAPHTHSGSNPTTGTNNAGLNVFGGNPTVNAGSIPATNTGASGSHSHAANVTTWSGGTLNNRVGRAGGPVFDPAVPLGVIQGPGNHTHPNLTSTGNMNQHFHGFAHSHNITVNVADIASTTFNAPHTHNLASTPLDHTGHDHSGNTGHDHFAGQTSQANDGNTIINIAQHTHGGPTNGTGSGAPISILSPFFVLKYIIKAE